MIRSLATLTVRLAVTLLPPRMRDWGRAMQAELVMIERATPVLQFALGCLACALREAIVFRITSPLDRHVDPTEALIRLETTPMPLPNSLDYRGRHLGALCAAAATGLGLAYMIAAGAPTRYLVMNAAALVLGLMIVAALASGPRLGGLANGAISISLAVALLLTALLGISADGVTRWISIGGVSIQPSLLLLPVLALLFARSRDGLSALAISIAALALALQPDRAMAGALAAGMAALAFLRPERKVLFALGAALTGAAATLLRPDESPAVPYVDQIFYSSFEVHPLAGASVLAGTLLMLVPAVVGSLRDLPNREIYSVFGAVWLAVAAAAALGNYPTPLVGYGGSAILGYLISLIGLPPHARSQAPADGRAAAGPPPGSADHGRILRAGL